MTDVADEGSNKNDTTPYDTEPPDRLMEKHFQGAEESKKE